MLENIPKELVDRSQWVVWKRHERDGKKTKVPYAPRSDLLASVADSTTWATFEEARAACLKAYDGVGFVLTADDPYCIIDLDNKDEDPSDDEELQKHEKILTAFRDTYLERSVSKSGYHIVCRAQTLKGVRRGHVEMYSFGRFMVFTGDVFKGFERPIIDCQILVDELYGAMTAGAESFQSLNESGGEQTMTDADVVDVGLNAINGEKFRRLGNGDWKELGYSSQSEADLAFLSMLCFYTPNNDQVRRLFRASMLGKRDKAIRNDDYINRSILRCRSGSVTPSHLQIERAMSVLKRLEEKEADSGPKAPPAPQSHVNTQYAPFERVLLPPFPPGLVGELAEYVLASSFRPVLQLSLITAIAFLAGIGGRSFNISNTGLNHYFLYVARTGTGKEGAASAISRIVRALRPTFPSIGDFVGPAFASGQAMLRTLSERPCFVSVMGEFGLLLRELSDSRASGPQMMIRRVMLDAFNKSGWSDSLQGTAYSDSQKNIKNVDAPCMTLLGETTPESLFDNLDVGDIFEGFLPRFHIIEYTGRRPSLNSAGGALPGAELLSKLNDFTSAVMRHKVNNTVTNLTTEYVAGKVLSDFNVECDWNCDQSSVDSERDLWNRAHLKALRLAGLIAVGMNPSNPVVSDIAAHWAVDFTRTGTLGILRRFSLGDVGKGESKRRLEMRRIILEYFKTDPATLEKYRIDPRLARDGLVHFRFIYHRAARLTSFKNDRAGLRKVINETLETMISMEELEEFDRAQALEKYGVRKSRVFFLTEGWR